MLKHAGRIVISCLMVGLITASTSRDADAQTQLPTTVQLPSFSSFSYQGTVVVPDGGTAHLGSVKRSAMGSTRRGMQRAFGADQGLSQATATVHIIDHNEIDRQLLGGTPQEFLRRQREKEARAGVTHRAPIDPDVEGKALVRHARKEYRAGNHSAAFASYQMAIEVLTPGLGQLATQEFKRVFGSSADQALRMSRLRR
ncbi:MAG: hypothetical protein HKN47_20715 [Pirellulaceae bacterium]|nr:hypothetical protein [Pirellulaceae bacterium]